MTEIVGAGRDQQVNASFIERIDQKIQQGDNSSSKTANAINASYNSLKRG